MVILFEQSCPFCNLRINYLNLCTRMTINILYYCYNYSYLQLRGRFYVYSIVIIYVYEYILYLYIIIKIGRINNTTTVINIPSINVFYIYKYFVKWIRRWQFHDVNSFGMEPYGHVMKISNKQTIIYIQRIGSGSWMCDSLLFINITYLRYS